MPRRKKADIDTSGFIGMVRQYIAEQGITPTDFAAQANIQLPALSRLLNDPTRRPEPEMVVAIADAMGRPVWDVAIQAGYPFSAPTVPAVDDARLLALIQTDEKIRDVIQRYYDETVPERRESLLQLGSAILSRRQSPE